MIGDTNANVYYYHTDQVGSIRAVTNQSGEIVFKADYLAFGTQHDKENDFDELHGFTGKEYDPDTGLYYYNARWYDSDTGRFLSEDAAGQGPNDYSYCGNNPIVRSDPTGHWWWLAINALFSGLQSQWTGGDFWSGAFVGAVTGGISMGVNSLLKGLGMAAGLGTNMLSGALGGGLTNVAFGGDFWDGARTGAISCGVSGFLTERTNFTGNIFMDRIKNWFNNAFGEFASTGKYSFSANDALSLSGIKDSIIGAISDAINPPNVVSVTEVIPTAEAGANHEVSDSSPQDVSDNYVKFLADYESFRSKPYDDGAGNMTVGYGHVILPGEDYSKGLTKAEALILLKRDLQSRVKDVNRATKGMSLAQNQYDTIFDYYYNTGGLKSFITTIKTAKSDDSIKNFLLSSYHVKNRKTGVMESWAGVWRRRQDNWEMWKNADYTRTTLKPSPLPNGEKWVW